MRQNSFSLMSMPRFAATVSLLSICVTGEGRAQATNPWTIDIGITSAPVGPADLLLVLGANRRIARTGPLEWDVGASLIGIATLRRSDNWATLTPYCPGSPGGCPGVNDASQLRLPASAGVTVRLVGLPWIFRRIVPEIGAGGYYASWEHLPGWDANRPSVLTGYRAAALGLQLTRYLGATARVSEYRNVRLGIPEAVGQVTLNVRFPSQ